MVVFIRSHMLLSVLLFVVIHMDRGDTSCYAPETIDYTLLDEYCSQPIFSMFASKTEEFQLIDNLCYTYFPLPDDPNTFTLYQSRVFCDGSHDVQSVIATIIGPGQTRLANPSGTYIDYIIGYAGCDTYIVYRCTEFGVSEAPVYIAGFSTRCNSIGLSCLRKVEEIISNSCLPDIDFYVFPNKLPNRCVTQQLCLQPPNPFYNTLSSVGIY